MTQTPSLVKLTHSLNKLHPDQLNVLASYKSPRANLKRFWLSYLIDFSLSIVIANQALNVFESFLNVMIYPQLVWQGREYFNQDFSLITLVIAPIIFWTMQFLGTFLANQTPGMKLMKIIILPKEAKNIKLSFLESMTYSWLALSSSWSLGLILFVGSKKHHLLEEITNLRVLKQDGYDWAQEMASFHPAPSFEEFPYKLVDQVSHIDEQSSKQKAA